jgi:hypothetical protein
MPEVRLDMDGEKSDRKKEEFVAEIVGNRGIIALEYSALLIFNGGARILRAITHILRFIFHLPIRSSTLKLFPLLLPGTLLLARSSCQWLISVIVAGGRTWKKSSLILLQWIFWRGLLRNGSVQKRS